MLPIKLFQLVFCLFWFNRNIETLCFEKQNNRNKRFVSDSAKTSFGSSFGCFESKLVSKDTLIACTKESPPVLGSVPKRNG
jgi:hypothetical protein